MERTSAMSSRLRLPIASRAWCWRYGDRIAATVGLATEFADALDAPQRSRLAIDESSRPTPCGSKQYAASRPFQRPQCSRRLPSGQSGTFDLDSPRGGDCAYARDRGDQDKLAGAPYSVAAFFAGGVAQTVPGVNHASALATVLSANERVPHRARCHGDHHIEE